MHVPEKRGHLQNVATRLQSEVCSDNTSHIPEVVLSNDTKTNQESGDVEINFSCKFFILLSGRITPSYVLLVTLLVFGLNNCRLSSALKSSVLFFFFSICFLCANPR